MTSDSGTTTFFADPARDTDEELGRRLRLLTENPVVDGILHSVGGLIAVLNERRQILAVNRTVLTLLAIDDPGVLTGLRPGEALECVHAFEMPGGCGTAKVCASCGAAISIVTSLAENEPVERICALHARKDGSETDLFFRVRCCPFKCGGERFLLLFLQDISEEQRIAVLKQIFIHDLKNTVTALVGKCEVAGLSGKGMSEDDRKELHRLSIRLAQEIKVRQVLSGAESFRFKPIQDRMSADSVVGDLESFFAGHPSSAGKRLAVENTVPGLLFTTDRMLCTRVLNNMITNAFEATAPGGVVRLSVAETDGFVEFLVRNDGCIPEAVRGRIFQRNFSTKGFIGRGVGTYSMKLFGEEILGGKVSFTTGETSGTVFSFRIPLSDY